MPVNKSRSQWLAPMASVKPSDPLALAKCALREPNSLMMRVCLDCKRLYDSWAARPSLLGSCRRRQSSPSTTSRTSPILPPSKSKIISYSVKETMQIPNVDRPPKLVLQLKGIVKAFAGVQALKGVDFDLRAGEVHALMGENGAGKSTLMKILFGVQPPDSGTIEIDGHGEVAIDDPRHALALGVGLVSQEPSLVPQLDVAQNIFPGQTEALNVVKRAQFQAKAREILKPLAPRLSVTTRVGNLGMAEMQVVEIARTLARGAKIIGFDE